MRTCSSGPLPCAKALRLAIPRLRAAAIDDAPGDCRRLMAFALGIGPDRLTLHQGDEMTGVQEAAFEAAVAAGAPEGTISWMTTWPLNQHVALADGSAVAVLTDWALPAQEVHAVFPSPKLVPSKVTHFIAFLQQSLAGEWWRMAPEQNGIS